MPAIADRLIRVDHIGIAVPSIAAAVPLFRDALGGRFLSGGDNDRTGLRLAQFAYPNFKIELMESLRDDSILAGTLASRGTGFHHLTFFVDDVERTATSLDEFGLSPTGLDTSSSHWSEVFLHPRDTFGALLQFASSTRRWDIPEDGVTLDDVLHGLVMWRDFVPCLRTAEGCSRA